METEQEKPATPPTEAPVSPQVESSEAPIVHTPIQTEVTPPSVQVPLYKRNKAMSVSVLVALILLSGAGYYLYEMQYGKGPAVAIVGGKKIYQKEFTEGVHIIEQNATAQGIDITDEGIKEQIKKQALENLINNVLLITAATDAGTIVSEDDVQKKYEELTTQVGGAEALATEMSKVGLSEEKLRSNIHDRVLTDAYIDAHTDIKALTITDEEIADFVKTITDGGQELPPLEQIRPQIEAQLLGQKQQQVVNDLIAKLRSESTVVIKI